MAFGIATIRHDGGPAPAVLTGQGVRSLRSVLAGHRELPATVRAMLSRWDEWCDEIGGALATEEHDWIAAEDVEFEPPMVDPPTIYCAGANYRDHILEMGEENPEDGTGAPFHFLLPRSAMTGHRKVVPRPAGCAQLDWELELVAVIGSEADRVDPEEAAAYVAGYTIANDVSARDPSLAEHPWFGVRWLRAKGQTAMLPIGPAIVPARFVADPMDLDLELSVEGDVKQVSNTSQMVFSVYDQIAHLSHAAPLLRGDLILTGTPAGTAAAHRRYLADGDWVNARISGLGTLVNQIVSPRKGRK